MRKGRTPAGFVPKPLRNRSRKNAETSLLEPIKKFKKKEIVPKPCETAARKLPKRCFWNLLKTKKKPASYQAKLKKKVFGTRMRKGRTPAGFVPKPLRNRSRKNAETSLLEPIKKRNAETLHLEPTKNKKKKVASSKANLCATSDLEACKPPDQTQEKGVWDAHAKRQNPSRFCAQAIAKPQPEKCRNVAFGTH